MRTIMMRSYVVKNIIKLEKIFLSERENVQKFWKWLTKFSPSQTLSDISEKKLSSQKCLEFEECLNDQIIIEFDLMMVISF